MADFYEKAVMGNGDNLKGFIKQFGKVLRLDTLGFSGDGSEKDAEIIAKRLATLKKIEGDLKNDPVLAECLNSVTDLKLKGALVDLKKVTRPGLSHTEKSAIFTGEPSKPNQVSAPPAANAGATTVITAPAAPVSADPAPAPVLSPQPPKTELQMQTTTKTEGD